jgi:hypothetical protein
MLYDDDYDVNVENDDIGDDDASLIQSNLSQQNLWDAMVHWIELQHLLHLYWEYHLQAQYLQVHDLPSIHRLFYNAIFSQFHHE